MTRQAHFWCHGSARSHSSRLIFIYFDCRRGFNGLLVNPGTLDAWLQSYWCKTRGANPSFSHHWLQWFWSSQALVENPAVFFPMPVKNSRNPARVQENEKCDSVSRTAPLSAAPGACRRAAAALKRFSKHLFVTLDDLTNARRSLQIPSPLFSSPVLGVCPLSRVMQGARPCNGSFEADTVERMHNVFIPPMWNDLNFGRKHAGLRARRYFLLLSRSLAVLLCPIITLLSPHVSCRIFVAGIGFFSLCFLMTSLGGQFSAKRPGESPFTARAEGRPAFSLTLGRCCARHRHRQPPRTVPIMNIPASRRELRGAPLIATTGPTDLLTLLIRSASGGSAACRCSFLHFASFFFPAFIAQRALF